MTRDEITACFSQLRDSWNRHDVPALVAAHGEDSVVESPFAGGVARGRDAIEKVYQAFFATFPDVRMDLDQLIIDGQRAVAVGRISGADRGGFMGMPPTGRSFDSALVMVLNFDNGLIAHERRIYDFTGLLVQVGAIKAKPA